MVPVNYKLVREASDCDSVFHITPTEGVLLHQAETRVIVTYKPQAFGTFSCENFTFTTPGMRHAFHADDDYDKKERI